MAESSVRRRIDVAVVHAESGVTYDIHVLAHSRPDGTWEAVLEFAPQNGETARFTDVETTQPSAGDVLYWAGGLTVSYFEGALKRALRVKAGRERPAPKSPLPTPLDPASRLARLQSIERHVMQTFREEGTQTLGTDHFFNDGPYSNADLVRAFEDLEKHWRYVVRETVGGTDRLRLTTQGAEAIAEQ